MTSIDTGGFGSSIGQLLGLGLGIKLGVEGFKAMSSLSKKPIRRRKKKTKRKRPRKGTGLFPTLEMKKTGNIFYPVQWSSR